MSTDDSNSSADEPEEKRKWFQPRLKKVERHTRKVGGFAFYLSLLFLLLLAVFCGLQIPRILLNARGPRLRVFFVAVVVGMFIGFRFVRGAFSVFLHELKHSIMSNLAGNKARGWKILESSGHFEYEFTKKTAHYNAIISLAPYFLPLATFIGSLCAVALGRQDPRIALACVGLGVGVDIILNVRDISPIQTDFSQIHGGFEIGLMYVAAVNVMLLCVVFAWAAGDLAGLQALWGELWNLVMRISLNVKGTAPRTP